MGQTREQKVIKQLSGVPTVQKQTPIMTDMFLPNHSGVHHHLKADVFNANSIIASYPDAIGAKISLLPVGSGGSSMQFGSAASAQEYMRIGPYSAVNNIDTKTRNLKIFSTAKTLAEVNATTGTWDFQANNITTTGTISGLGMVPIGVYLPWDKTLLAGTSAETLPANFVEANGQTISDAASPLNGKTLRNLNGYGGGTKRFIRGSTTSGTEAGADAYTPAGTIGTASAWHGNTAGCTNQSATCVHTHVFTGTSASYLPSYCEFVFIVRIK